MMSMAQAYSPHPAGLQHPGVAPGHPMGPGHPQQGGGQPGSGMPQQMHMGAGPGGPQVTQAGAMLGGMPPGVSGPGPSAHALQHLNPNQAQMYQQQQMAYANPQIMAQQQHLMQQQQQHRQAQAAARQAMMAQQQQFNVNGGMPMNMPNGMNPQMNQAQFAAMRGNPNMRPQVALPLHLQQQQIQAQVGLEQQQAQQQVQQQQQQQHQAMIAQQMAMQQANAAAGQAATNPGQASQLGQPHNLQNTQIGATQQQQQPPQQQQQGGGAQQPQAAGQPQPQTPQPQQAQPPPAQQQPTQQQQQQMAAAASMMQARPRDQIKGHCILKLVQFGDHLSQFVGMKQREDLAYWSEFVETFFSPRGVLRHSVWIVGENSNKQYEITFPALARYFYTHFESGISNMQMITEKAKEKELPNNCHYIESQKSSFIYWFENGSQLVAHGTLRAQFDANQKIELLEFVTNSHDEYVSRTRIVEAARPLHEWQKEWQKANQPVDGKQSPEMSKKKSRPMKSPPQAPPDIDIPESKVKSNMGITPSVFRFLEFAEVLGQMNPLFSYSHVNPSLTPYNALEQYVANVAVNGSISAPTGGGQGMLQPGQRTPSMGQFPMGQSPSAAHLGLPENVTGGSPALGHMQAPGMALQQSQQGTNSSGPSANTSPNVSNKRRRPSVKTEGDETGAQPNGVQPKVKPSPRMGQGKRQKQGNAA